MRLKNMSMQQFDEVMKREWTPVKLVGEAVPDWLRNIPESVVDSIYASGIRIPGVNYLNTAVPGASLVGGIHVFRNAPDDPVKLNKDYYPVVVVPDCDSMLLVLGPYKDAEHWLDDIPMKLEGAEVLGLGISASGVDY